MTKELIKIPLHDPEILEAIKKYLNEIILFDLIQEAFAFKAYFEDFWKETPDFEEKYPELHEEYKNLVIKAKFIALPLLEENEILELFKNNFVDFFVIPDLDIWEKIRAKLISITLPQDRDVFKRRLMEALKGNQQLITSKELSIGEEKVPPTVGKWIEDYDKNLGLGRVDKLKQNQYLVSNPNFQNLTEIEKQKIKTLYNLYENLKLSSLTHEGREENVSIVEGGKLKIVRRGVAEDVELPGIEKIVRKAMEVKRREKLLRAYLGDLQLEEKIKKEEELLKSIQDFEKTKEELIKALDKKEKEKSIAILRILASNDAFESVIKSKEFFEVIKSKIQEKYGEYVLRDFEKDPVAPPYFSIFLQHILKDRIQLDENESARIGMQLNNILMKAANFRYRNELVYFDEKKNKFEWI